MLMGFDLFLAQVRGYRMVWLPGRFSGGKTAMACRMAWDMKKRWGLSRCIQHQLHFE